MKPTAMLLAGFAGGLVVATAAFWISKRPVPAPLIISSAVKPLPEVEAVCDRALIISRGALVADGTVEEIRARGSRSAVVAVVRASKEDEALDAGTEAEEEESAQADARRDLRR